VERLGGNEPPGETASEAQQLPQALVLDRGCLPLHQLEGDGVPLEHLALTLEPRGPPAFRVLLKAHQGRDDGAAEPASDGLAHLVG
jgi:hypothetical protein